MRTLPALAPRIVHHLLQLEFGHGDGSEGAPNMLTEYDLLLVELVDEARELVPEMRSPGGCRSRPGSAQGG